MGTSYSVKVVAGDLGESVVGELEALVERELGAVNSAMSTYLEDSELSRLNRAEGGRPVTVSDAPTGTLRSDDT